MTPAEQLNPQYWTAERIERVRKASPRTFTMHVNNQFGGAENALLSKHELDQVICAELPPGMVWSGHGIGALDTAQGKEHGDGFCFVAGFHARAEQSRRARMVMHDGFAVCPMRDEWGRVVYDEMPSGTVLRIAEVHGWEGASVRGMTIGDIVAAVAARCRAWNIGTLFGDQFESTGIGGLLSQHGIKYRPYHWSADSKASVIGGTLKRHVRERTISIVPHSELYRELLSIREAPRAGGRWGYETGGLDFASALISLLHGLDDPEVIGLDPRPHAHVSDAAHQVQRSGRYTTGGR